MGAKVRDVIPANLPFVDPRLMLKSAETGMAAIPNEVLFVKADVRFRDLFERWCAGSFGSAYGVYVAPCEVAVNDQGTRGDADFFLRTRGSVFAFQTVEVIEPGRRRGDEYRKPGLTPYEPGRAAADGPEWLETGVRGKLEKRYAGARDLHLLVYANFTAEALQFADVAARLAGFRGEFASVWVMAHHVFGSVFSSAELGSVAGWRTIRTPADWNP
jgi:hypothetical protein